MGVLVVETLQNRIVAIIVYYYCLFNCQLKYHFFQSSQEISRTEDFPSHERCGTHGDRQLMSILIIVGFCKYNLKQKVNKCFS